MELASRLSRALPSATRDLALEDIALLPDVREGLLRATLSHAVRGIRGAYSRLDHNPEGLYLRLGAIFLTESRTFEMVSLATICVNCVVMALDYPVAPGGPPNPAQELLEECDRVFLVLYTAEMLLKMTAFGVGHLDATSWWMNRWALFEGIIVLISWTPFLSFLPTIPHGILSVLRAMRSLRVLRALFIIPGMKELIGSTLEAVPALASVAALWGLVIWMMSIAGVQLFKGTLHKRCALLPELTDEYLDPLTDAPIFCGLPVKARSGGEGASGEPLCPAGIAECALLAANPFKGTLSFDSALDSVFPLVHTLIGDSWSANMYALMDAGSGLAWLYFCPLAAVGGFLLVQLFLAVISESFVGAESARKEAEALRETMTIRLQARFRGFLARRRSESLKEKEAQRAAALEEEDWSPTSSDLGRTIRRTIGMLMRSVNHASQAVVVFNVMVMCMRYHGEPPEWKALQTSLGDVATWFFIAEMALKLAFHGCAGYWADRWNCLDGSLVLASVAEIILHTFFRDFLSETGGFTPMLRMLRMLRIVRALKAARSMPTLQKMISNFVESVPQVLNLVVFMAVVMFIFAIVGMQLFGASGMSDVSRLHFDSFPAAITSVLTILLGKYVVIYQAGYESGQGFMIGLFVYAACLVLYLSLANLFVAILVQAFSSDGEAAEAAEAAESEAAESEAAAEAAEAAESEETVKEKGEEDGEGGTSGGGAAKGLASLNAARELPPPPSWLVRAAYAMVGPAPTRGAAASDAEPDPLPTERRATCCDHVDIRPRRWFERFVLALILVSSLTIAIDVPRLPSDSTTKLVLDQLTHVFTVTFILELVAKMIAWGPRAYFKEGWNVLDFFIVAASILSLLVRAVPELEFLIAFRVLRVLRPLRLLARNEGTRLVMNVLFNCFGIVGAIGAVILFVMTVFGSAHHAPARPHATHAPPHLPPSVYPALPVAPFALTWDYARAHPAPSLTLPHARVTLAHARSQSWACSSSWEPSRRAPTPACCARRTAWARRRAGATRGWETSTRSAAPCSLSSRPLPRTRCPI